MSNEREDQYRDVSNDLDLTDEEKDKIHAHNCAPGYHSHMNLDQRRKAASILGPNWASVLAGHGDQ